LNEQLAPIAQLLSVSLLLAINQMAGAASFLHFLIGSQSNE